MADILSQKEINMLLDVCVDETLNSKFDYIIDFLKESEIKGDVANPKALVHLKDVEYIIDTLKEANTELRLLNEQIVHLNSVIAEKK